MSDWEAHYQAGDMPWDKGGPSPGLVEFLENHRMSGRVLVPGCGLGHDVRAIAAAGAEALGADIAPTAVARARQIPPAGAERYEVLDFFALPPELQGRFDWVWEHTCFCAINPSQRADYAAAAAAALKPGGHFLGVFYLDPGNGRPTDGPPFETTLAELDRLFLPRFELIRQWAPGRAYPGRGGREWMRLLRRKG